jgi:hypothetical protein
LQHTGDPGGADLFALGKRLNVDLLCAQDSPVAGLDEQAHQRGAACSGWGAPLLCTSRIALPERVSRTAQMSGIVSLLPA